MKIIFNLFLVVSYCVVILRTPSYWSVRVASCNFKLGVSFISITHNKRYDVQTWYCFRRRVKRFIREIIWPEWLTKSKAVQACGSSPEKAVPTRRKLPLWSSLHQYINNQHPTAKNDNCLFRRHPRTPASCDIVVWIQLWTRNEKTGSKWVQT